MTNKLIEYVVYRYVSLYDEVLYVGKTTNLRQRFSAHKSEDMHKECYTVEYIELENEADIEIYETYYINKWLPKYNKAKIYSLPSFQMPEQEWKVFYVNSDNDPRYSSEIKRYEEMFKDINSLKFENILPMPRIVLKDTSLDGQFVKDRLFKGKDDFIYTIVLNEDECINNTEFAMLSLFHNMIHMYCFLKNIKDTSNNGIYHNKKFGAIAKQMGCLTNTCKYGFTTTGFDDSMNEIINKYNINYPEINRDIFIQRKNKKRPSSTRKYIDTSNGQSVRATKGHILFCLDDKPDIAREISKKYKIYPMKEVS